MQNMTLQQLCKGKEHRAPLFPLSTPPKVLQSFEGHRHKFWNPGHDTQYVNIGKPTGVSIIIFGCTNDQYISISVNHASPSCGWSSFAPWW